MRRDPNRNPSILEVTVARIGLLRATQVMVFIGQWAHAMQRRKDVWPALDSRGAQTERLRLYCDVWLENERTAWRHLKRFRQAWPNESDPTRMVEFLLAHAHAQAADQLDPANIALVEVPPDFGAAS